MELVQASLAEVRVPGGFDKVYKNECAYSFATPWCSTGLFTSLNSWRSAGDDFLAMEHDRSGNRLYLHQKWTKQLKPAADTPEAQEAQKPDKLAIGIDGGFASDPEQDKYTTTKEHQLVVMPEKKFLPISPDLPLVVGQAVDAIIAHDDVSAMQAVDTWQDEIKTSKYAADLIQLDTGRKISRDPASWKCDESGTTQNLWLNLSTGHIGSGRPNWDGTGGTGAALRHFEETEGKYPLTVKLGTITPNGADVFSYAADENDMVSDPLLDEHLAHWGIFMKEQEKTVKTMAELQIDLNMSYEFDKISEAGKNLEPVTGPGLIGLENLGNSCYMNSVLQLMAVLPALKDRYVTAASKIFQTAPPNVAEDFPSQLAKVASALLTGAYAIPKISGPQPEYTKLKPVMFKALVGTGHPEFSSQRQQDALEYLQHLTDFINKSERQVIPRIGGDQGSLPLCRSFEFQIEDRLQCDSSQAVRYTMRSDNCLSLNIPLDAATNRDEYEAFQDRQTKRAKTENKGREDEEPVKLRVPLSACLEDFAASEKLEDFYSSAIQGKTSASKYARLKTFPDFLFLHMRRYYFAEDGTGKKLDVLVDVDDTLNLEELRAIGLQDGEKILPEEEVLPAKVPTADQALVGQLVDMGFSSNGSSRALLATGNNSIEASMEWIMAHMNDSDFNDPIPPPIPESEGSFAADPESVTMLSSMGFPERHSTAALKACDGDIERATDWMFSRADNIESAVDDVLSINGLSAQSKASTSADYVNGQARYRLVGFASHMGSNTGCGHYVAHVEKDGRWILFNDGKVAVSKTTPKELGYLYLYQRL